MTDMLLERDFDGMTPSNVHKMARDSENCFKIHQVDWRMSFLSNDGSKMLCWYSSRDAESARMALRESGATQTDVWAGTVHDGPDAQGLNPNVLVLRSFDEPVELDDIQAIEDAGAWCLETYHVKFFRTFFSLDRKRMICLYQAPDAESVRLAQRQANMPVDDIWSFKQVLPGE